MAMIASNPGELEKVEPGMTLSEAAAVVIEGQLWRLQANEAGALSWEDPEHVHDMRVATRTLRAALRVFDCAVETDERKMLMEDLRWLAGLLGEVRDADVLVSQLRQYMKTARSEDQGTILALVLRVERRRDPPRVALAAGIWSERYASLKGRLDSLVGRLQSTDAGDVSVAEHAVKTIREQYRRVQRAGIRAQSGRQRDMHRLRIECKRLRYCCEFFAGLYDQELKRTIKNCTKIQGSLGAARDSYLQRQTIKTLASGVRGGEARALRRLRRALKEQEQADLKRYRAAAPRLLNSKGRKQLERELESRPE